MARERGRCWACEKAITVYVPRSGDGSALIFRKHTRRVKGVKRVCEGSHGPVESDDILPDVSAR